METFTISYVGKDNFDDRYECVNICHEVFSKHSSNVKYFIMDMADWNLSLKAVINNKIVGCYILQEDTLTCSSNTGFNVDAYKGLRGLHGVGLAVLPQYRELGIGKALRTYPSTMGYDFIYGMHLASLNNLDHWKKLREVVYTSPTMHITIQDFRKTKLTELSVA